MVAAMEFELQGNSYRVAKIAAREQFHIMRRLAPVFGSVAPVAQNGGVEAIQPLAEAIGALSDENADYVLFGLLKAVQRKEAHGLGYSPICSGNTLMYDDISMPVMLQLAWKALQHNGADFFAALPSGLKEAAQKASAP